MSALNRVPRAGLAAAPPATPSALAWRFAPGHPRVPVAYPPAWLPPRVSVEPRGHVVTDIPATNAIRHYAGPILAIHGTEDRVIPFTHLACLVEAAHAARAGDPAAATVG